MKIAFRPVLGIGAALSVVALAVAGVGLPSSQVCAAEPTVSFSEDVLPLLKWRCTSCHQPGGEGFVKSGLDLTTYEGVMKGTKFGPMVIPGSPETSNLMQVIDWTVSPDIRMPHGKKQLPVCDRAFVRTWIREGANNN